MATASRRRLVVVGESGSGKTCLLLSFAEDVFPGPDTYVPKVYDSFASNVEVSDGSLVDLVLWDTNSGEEEDEKRSRSYQGTDVFLVCFSVASRESLERVKSKWLPEVRRVAPSAPFVLVGNKVDLRKESVEGDQEQQQEGHEQEQNGGKPVVQKEEGGALALELGAWSYRECSAKTREGVKEVFAEAARVAQQKRQEGSICALF